MAELRAEISEAFGATPPHNVSQQQLATSIVDNIRSNTCLRQVILKRLAHEKKIGGTLNGCGGSLPRVPVTTTTGAGNSIPHADELEEGPLYRAVQAGYLHEGGILVKVDTLSVYKTRVTKDCVLKFPAKVNEVALTIYRVSGAPCVGDESVTMRLEEDSTAQSREMQLYARSKRGAGDPVSENQRAFVGRTFTDEDDERVNGDLPVYMICRV